MKISLTKIRRYFSLPFMAVSFMICLSQPSFADHEGSDGALDQPGHEEDLKNNLDNRWLPTFGEMADQFSATMVHQVFGIATLVDAKFQMEGQRLYATLRAEAHKNYHPSETMCRYGTNVRSLAATEELARANKRILSQILQQRLTLRNGSVGERGRYFDKRNRFEQFRRVYCDPQENNGGFRSADIPANSVCMTARGGARIDRDVNFTGLIDTRLTLDVDLTNSTMTNDEQDVMALARNLYSHDLLDYKADDILSRDGNTSNILETRSLHALRSVAHNSFADMVGMKAMGSGTVGTFMKRMISELGVPDGEIDQFLGAKPSYFAQMEVMTKKMYQNPVFYTNLYTKPENVRRTGVALQALQIMHDRDRFEASLRREMLLSSILEMKLREAQEVIDGITAKGKTAPTGK